MKKSISCQTELLSSIALGIFVFLFPMLPGENVQAGELKHRIAEEASPIEPPVAPVDLRWGPQLFVDDFLIEESRNVSKTTHSPQRHAGNPILGHQQGTTQPYVTVIRDEETGKFRMWYNRDAGKEAAIAYAESKDGIAWETPKLGVLGEENKLFPISSEFQNGYGVSVLDEGKGVLDPSRRYKAAWWGQEKEWPDGDPGLRVAFSEDGIHWTKYEGNPVLPDFSELPYFKEDDRRKPYGVGDIIDVYWDPFRTHYGVMLKSPAVASDELETGPKARTYIRRLVSTSLSNDFINWFRPWRVIVPEDKDEGLLEFYGVGGPISRGSLLIGFIRMLRDDVPHNEGAPAEGIGYATLATSRDGIHWERQEDIFFDRNSDPEAWDRAMCWIGCCLTVGDEMYFYYGGYKQGHKINPKTERQLGLATLPLDRFVSRDSEEKGYLRTIPCYLADGAGKRLVLNCDGSQGSIRVQIKDNQGKVVPGFAFEDCQPIQGDGLREAVAWKSETYSGTSDLSALFAETVHLEFELNKASLYGFDVVEKQDKK